VYFNIAVTVLRYIFLFFMFLFIFRLVKWMVDDLRETGKNPAGANSSPAFPQAGAEAVLAVVESFSPDLKKGDSFDIRREILIGRSGRCDIVIKDSFTSTEHARIFVKDGQYWLEDMKSTNGTYLNGVRLVRPVALANRDEIRAGSVTFRFVRWGHEVGQDY